MAIDLKAYANGVQNQLAELRKNLKPLESGQMKLGSNDGSGWKDVTVETIAHDRQVIETYEAILKDVRSRIERGAQ